MFSGNGNYTPRRGDNTPRLPPIAPLNDQMSAIALLDRTSGLQNEMQFINDERRARQMLEEQVKVITSVCKKLNQDIEALDSQLNERTFVLNNLEFKTNELQGNNISLNKDLQFKMSRHDALLNKLENESATSLNGIKDLQARHQDSHRTMMMRISEVENRLNDLNSRIDSILMEQTMVLKNVEGDTVKQLQLIDGKTRTMLEDLRGQLNQTRAIHETEISRLESRMTLKIDESIRNNEKYDRLERKLDEYSQSMNKRFLAFEDDFQKSLLKLTMNIEKLENKVNKGIEERASKTGQDYEKLRKEMKFGFQNLQESIIHLENVTDGKIKLTEDKLEKEIEKIRKMVVLI